VLSRKIAEGRPTENVLAIERPAFYTEVVRGKNGSLVQLLHPDHGWLTFVLPPECAGRLGTQLIKHPGLCEYFAGTLLPSTVAVN
jgi:hypothetical protein